MVLFLAVSLDEQSPQSVVLTTLPRHPTQGHMGMPPVPPTWGGATGAVCPGPQCKGAPKQCQTRSNLSVKF